MADGRSTQRNPAAKPATQAIRPATQQVKPTTQRVTTGSTAPTRGSTGQVPTQRPATGQVQKATGQVQKPTGAHKRTTGRASARSSARSHVGGGKPAISGRTFMMASGALLAIGAIAGIVWAIGMTQDDPKKLKEEIADLSKQFKDLGDEKTVERLALCISVRDNEKYKKYCVAEYNVFCKNIFPLEELIKRQKEADSEVLPFLRKWEDSKEKAPGDEALATQLYDEVKALHDLHNLSRHGPKLTEIKTEITKILESFASVSWPSLWVKLQADALKLASKETRDHVGAFKLLKDFGDKFKEKEQPELAAKLKEERAKHGRLADGTIKDLVAEAGKLVKDGKKADAMKLLEGARKGYEGLPQADKLEETIRGIKP